MNETAATTDHPLSTLSDRDRLRVSWFRTHHLHGPTHGRQVWVLETLCAMSDKPLAVDVFDFHGTFAREGMAAATGILTATQFRPASQWHLTHDGHTWALDSLRPGG